MLCSAAELGLDEDAGGLLELDAGLRPGTPLTQALQLDDHQIEVDLTPNRADCLSVAGLARELSALTGVAVKSPPIKAAAVRGTKRVTLTLQAKADCPRYAGRVIEGIDPRARTPWWMRERLRRAGVRSIHPVVDVTNYVMLELGQPMHAFDLDALSGGIVVRAARAGESLALLDGTTIKPPAGTLLIADSKRPLALAGIMGGQDSAVEAGTTNIFLESAWFRPQAIGPRARALGLHTESSHRFERGVDPDLQRRALERATALLTQIVGGRPGPVVEQRAGAQLPKRRAIALRSARVARLLGIDIPAKDIAATFKRLGLRAVRTGQGWRVTPPSWRFDLQRECDLIEEVARLTGYEKLPVTRPQAVLTPGALPEGRLEAARLRDILIDRDYQEAITYSFVDPAVQELIHPGVQPVALTNPIASDLAVMRLGLWPGLLQVLRHNLNRQQERVRLFEIGRRFVPEGGQTREPAVIAGLVTGDAYSRQWGLAARPVDFHDAKGDVEVLLAAGGQGAGFRFLPFEHPALHPGQTAEIRTADGQNPGQIGVLGRLHPAIAAKLAIDRPVFLFELDLDTLTRATVPCFREISRFPAIRRDLALVVDIGIPAARVLDGIRQTAGELLTNLQLFDEYRGEGIDSGRKSLALGLTFQDSSRTLREAEVEALMTQLIQALGSTMGATLRQ
jgi:phenylalanyl-tRNA synthetase beta chain